MPTRDRRHAALDAYLQKPSAAGLDRVRATIEGELVDRIALFTDRPSDVSRALDAAFAAFASASRPGAGVNWFGWIAARAMSVACGERDGACWADQLAAGFAGTVIERRALIFGVILTLEGRCQWTLLRRRLRPRATGPAATERCHRNLLQRLDLISG